MDQPHPDDLPEQRSGEVVNIEVTENLQRVYLLLEMFGGLPLTVDDIGSELQISHHTVRDKLKQLLAIGLVGSKPGEPRTTLYYWIDPEEDSR